ncbi:hypothetical protein [Bacillus sp. JCM 19034]|uniref:hypothetical protein n=1 Tax=Bacillus sp. JCM 19034 TaxID=1481928 RepID=UPI0007822E43|nr:hypothetical protein [Bacillus sp. JCM 19034]
MSIRFKLVISYVCMILLPIALAILFLHLLFHLFVGNIEEMKDHYNVEKTFFAEVMNDDLPIYLNLQNHAKEEPELFRNDSFLAQYKEQLDKRKVILLVWEDEEMIYQSAFIDDHVFSELPSDEERNQQGALKVDSGAWVYTMNDFYFADGEKGSYILMLDVDPIDSFIRIVVPT